MKRSLTQRLHHSLATTKKPSLTRPSPHFQELSATPVYDTSSQNPSKSPSEPSGSQTPILTPSTPSEAKKAPSRPVSARSAATHTTSPSPKTPSNPKSAPKRPSSKKSSKKPSRKPTKKPTHSPRNSHPATPSPKTPPKSLIPVITNPDGTLTDLDGNPLSAELTASEIGLPLPTSNPSLRPD